MLRYIVDLMHAGTHGPWSMKRQGTTLPRYGCTGVRKALPTRRGNAKGVPPLSAGDGRHLPGTRGRVVADGGEG
jgi:hypothetical protein